MLTEDVANRFPHYKGMNLIDFAEVALPIYRITATTLVQEKIKLPTIEEFLLRSIHIGFTNINDMHKLLGLSLEVTKGGLTGLIRSDLVVQVDKVTIKLTVLGDKAAKEYSKMRPAELQLTFDYDGLVRRVCINKDSIYFSPKEVKELGLSEIRSIPARRPSEDEVDLREVTEFIKSYKSTSESNKTLLSVRKISRAVRLFYKAVMLIYKESETGKYEAVFCIDGQISELHGVAFDKANGFEKLGFLKQVKDGEKKTLDKEYLKYIPRPEKQIIGKKVLRVKKKIHGKTYYVNENEKVKVKEKKISETIPVNEHPKLLQDCLSSSRKRLIIISPWITTAVVNEKFISSLETLLKKGVDIKIGYGFGEEKNKDANVEKKLKSMSDKYDNFLFKYFGDTHAKILIKDDEYYVITSFNWLSFKGDPNRTFREEWGNYVGDVEKVNEFYNVISERFLTKVTGN